MDTVVEITILKGDVEGHEFHGNQYTAGEQAAASQRAHVIAGRTDPQRMTAGQINRELDSLDARSSTLNTALINAGFGDVRPSDVRENPSHPMASHPAHIETKAVDARQYALRQEVAARMGPSNSGRITPGQRNFRSPKPEAPNPPTAHYDEAHGGTKKSIAIEIR